MSSFSPSEVLVPVHTASLETQGQGKLYAELADFLPRASFTQLQRKYFSEQGRR